MLVFKHFSLYTGSLSNPFYILLLNVIPHFFICSQKIFILIKKDIYLVSLKHFNISTHFFGSIILNCLILLTSFLYPINYLKPFLSNRTLFDITILPIFTSFISTEYLNLWNALFLTLISSQI